jgi:hypothetical protein
MSESPYNAVAPALANSIARACGGCDDARAGEKGTCGASGDFRTSGYLLGLA